MTQFALLISPRARAAFFADTDKVALAEISGVQDVAITSTDDIGTMRFVTVEAPEARLYDLLRLSVVQGAFRRDDTGFHPVDAGPDFALHEDFVWGEKYRGKTSETLTQLLISIALQELGPCDPAELKLLDPMCGRGTSLFWAMRFGIAAQGVEQDPIALQDIRRGLKKWTKLHRQKHKLMDGFTQKANKKGVGKFLEFKAERASAKIITGDTVNLRDLVQRQKFDLLVTDLPYGVQHMGSAASRSPLAVIEAAAQGWAESMAPGGVMAIAFNAYMPKPDALAGCFDGLGLSRIVRDVSHRMSESIVRDVLILKKD